ncbi:MAG: 23S rRNA (pseudouridine(1915)-N(3))-methyltransferase RlmH [Deltaproteobacteria bacterium]|nr:23S rRNA (pseudouridine(1915)-N(3))-methyltransferase RlmH [Deltaproteobacteria bacterium]MBW2660126.1 23S rRNA (pseudouridine(1915)-N(3))-methyltransferase RlmH [Deltaproteobacteria bacterium]
MKHELLFLGKTKDSYIAEGIELYLSRLGHYTSVSTSILREKKGKRGKSNKDDQATLLLKAIPPGAFSVALDSGGKQFSSESFSRLIADWELRGTRKVCYLIGGPDGLSSVVTRSANLLLSFSKMTFTHDMVRLFLVEQIYRAYTIKAGEKYHK